MAFLLGGTVQVFLDATRSRERRDSGIEVRLEEKGDSGFLVRV